MGVVDAVERDLAGIRRRDPALADSALAALALALAGEIDAEGNSATSKSMNAHQLRDTVVKLWELAPPERVKDRIDELRTRREADRGSAPTDRPHPRVRKVKGA